ncbi:MAG TPA: LysM peptidoglycan-binding domain-containing protein [Streptosporangiaceae bacterium]|nr:LysM peptidoglycan-binding domain-containing protein [Streptosporangiaceae bacterium]
MSPQAAPVANAATAHTAVLDAANQLSGPPATSARAAAAAQQTTRTIASRTTARTARAGSASALPATYRVRHGDSLSSIARRLYHDRADWPALYWRNHRRIRWADDIYAGQVLHVPAKPAHEPTAPAALQPTPAPQVPSAAAVAPQVTAGPAAGSVTAEASTATPGGAFGACVVAAESGGNPQIMNATGHYGLYQFSESTWIAYGGSAADFGHASVAEQNQVFANALAAGGESNWAPYDGC